MPCSALPGAAAPLSWLAEHRGRGTRSGRWAPLAPAPRPAPLRPEPTPALPGPAPLPPRRAACGYPQPREGGRQPWQGPEPPPRLPARLSAALHSHRGHRDLLKGGGKKAMLSAQLPVVSPPNSAGELKRTLGSVSPRKVKEGEDAPAATWVPSARLCRSPQEAPIPPRRTAAPGHLPHGVLPRPRPREPLPIPQSGSGPPSELSRCPPMAVTPSRSPQPLGEQRGRAPLGCAARTGWCQGQPSAPPERPRCCVLPIHRCAQSGTYSYFLSGDIFHINVLLFAPFH